MQRGDHIVARRGAYTHHGIAVGDGTAIHYSGEPTRKAEAMVQRTSLWAFAAGNAVETIRRPGCERAAEVIVARAKTSIGLDGYSLWNSNCEHFASWCFSENWSSSQIERLIDHAYRTAVLTVWNPAGGFLSLAVSLSRGFVVYVARANERLTARRQYVARWELDVHVHAQLGLFLNSASPGGWLHFGDGTRPQAVREGPAQLRHLGRVYRDTYGTAFVSNAAQRSWHLMTDDGAVILNEPVPALGRGPTITGLGKPWLFEQIERSGYAAPPR